MHYAEIEPFGIDADDFRAMTLNSTIAAVAGAKDLDPSAFSLSHFLDLAHASFDDVSPEARLDRLLGVPSRDEVN
jgi:hypothetical protein